MPDPAGDSSPAPRRPRVLAVGGGRGGVGKTLLTANVGIYLAQVGKRVVLVDLDTAGGNLHTCLGIDRPRTPLSDSGARTVDEVADAVVETPVPGLSLVTAVERRTGAASLRPIERRRLIAQVRALEVDYVLLDLGAGTTPQVFDFFLAADAGILVVVPEPTAVESTYRFLRGAFLRKARRALFAERPKLRILRDAARSESGVPNPAELCDSVAAIDAQTAEMLRAECDTFRPKLVVNQTRLRTDLDVGDALRTVIGRKMGLAVEYLGPIEHDDAVWLSVRRRRPLLVETPGSKASKNLERICRRILATEGKVRPDRPPRRPSEEAPLDHYEVLEVEPGASEDEIRRAHRRMRGIFEERSLVTYGLYEEDEIAVGAARVAEAYDVLIDPSRRREYDRAVLGDRRAESKGEVPATEVPPAQEEAAVELRPDTEFSGAMLRRIRQSRGVDLREIIARTKISHVHLRAIEEEDFPALPALVYTRGFVAELAKYLRLDPSVVSKSYIRRYRRYLEASGRD